MSSQTAILRRMEREMCFICGMTISRGNRSEVSQQKMDKLVSVQRTVEHSRYGGKILYRKTVAKIFFVTVAKNILAYQVLKIFYIVAPLFATSCPVS